MAGDVIVLKFGSSVLRVPEDLPVAVHEVYRWYRAGWRVIAVVSAIGNTTETLLGAARLLASEPDPAATADLLATGERHSAALLGIALDEAGVPARVVDPREIHLLVEGDPLDSDPISADRDQLRRLLDAASVVVVPGFFGYDAHGAVHLLGRGGSDLSAVFLAHTLAAQRCRLIKDVDGVYEIDPATAAQSSPRRLAALNYAEALACAGQLIQPKALRYLERHGTTVEVAGLALPYESAIGPFQRAVGQSPRAAPLDVVMLGLGTVGLGVYQRLVSLPNHFRVVGAFVRDPAKHIANGVPASLLHTSTDQLGNLHADVVVDALPGVEPSHVLVEQSLSRRISVVSANKLLIAEAGPTLVSLAQHHGARLLYAAAVGGSAPMLEAVNREARAGEIRCIAGILNGTCNYVLDRCSEGIYIAEALRRAQEQGFAEADASEDLSGHDAARKLRILVRHAFGQELAGLAIEPLNAATLLRARASLRANEMLRLIARAWNLGSRVLGQIHLEAVPHTNNFAHTPGEWNRLVITRATGEDVVVQGRGAGRWPTAEAVLADLLELRFARYS